MPTAAFFLLAPCQAQLALEHAKNKLPPGYYSGERPLNSRGVLGRRVNFIRRVTTLASSSFHLSASSLCFSVVPLAFPTRTPLCDTA